MPDQRLPFSDLLHRRVLVVEDDPSLAKLLCEDLTMSGAEVVGPAANLFEALALVGTTPDLAAAVLDVDLQGIAAYPVADALLRRDVPFVFVTASTPAELTEGYRQFPIVTKPASVHRIMNALIG